MRMFVRASVNVLLMATWYATLAPGGLATPSPAAAAPVVWLNQVLAGFTQPLFVTDAGDGSNRLFVVEKPGTIKVVGGGQTQATPFLDLRTLVLSAGAEQGLLGLAFDPNFRQTGRFFVYYTAVNTGADTLAAYRVSGADPNRADPSSGVVLLAIPDPYSNHNGGMLAFGPDGYLYLGDGDGGGDGDPLGNGQNLNTLLGKILRLDVTSGAVPYGIPPSNPFIGKVNARPEIWAYGLRNPWRFSFDRSSGDLWIGDVGQNNWEEIDFQPAGSRGGENYGWNIMEGLSCYQTTTCNRTGLTLPVAVYDHTVGCAITGGYMYRGSLAPSLVGSYVFGDYCSGLIWSLRRDSSGAYARTTVLDSPYYVSSFGQDQAGELYVTDLAGGGVYQLSESAPTPSPTPTPVTSTPTLTPTPTATPIVTATPTPTAGASGPDLVITSFTGGPGESDQPIPLTVTVRNQGTQDTGGGFDVHVFADLGRPPTPADTAYVAHLGFPDLPAGASATLTGNVLPNMLAPGDHVLAALADGHDTVAESDETNNVANLVIHVNPPATPTATPIPSPTAPPTSVSTPTPSFQYTFDDGTTQGWLPGGVTASEVASTTAAAHDGSSSLGVTLTQASLLNWGAVHDGNPTSLTPGTTITAWVLVPAGSPGGLQAEVYLQDALLGWYSASTPTALVPGTWSSLRFTVPTSVINPVSWFGVWFTTDADQAWTGTVYVDSVQVTPPAQAQYTFEDGTTDGWLPGGTTAAAVTNSKDAAHTGSDSLAVTLNNTTDTAWASAYVRAPANVTPGTTTITAWVFVPPEAPAGLNGRIYLRDTLNNWYSAAAETPLVPGTWTELVYAVPSIGLPVSRFGVWFTADSGVSWSGLVYIDDVL